MATLGCAVCIALNKNVLLASCAVTIGYVGAICSYIACTEKKKRDVAYTALVFLVLYISFFLIALMDEPSFLFLFPMLNVLLALVWLAVSTLFIGISIKSRNKTDKWLKCLLCPFGIIFVVSIIIIFEKSTSPIFYGDRLISNILIGFCIAYYLAICVLSLIHFHRMPKADITDALPPQDMTNDEVQ